MAVTFLNSKNDGFSVSTQTINALCREFNFRSTQMGALTLTIVYNPATKEVIRPHRVETSKSGTHGTHIYCLDAWDELWIVKLEVSNTGKRSVVFSRNVPQDVANKVVAMWLAGASISDIINALKSA
jgi:hypothetical protein